MELSIIIQKGLQNNIHCSQNFKRDSTPTTHSMVKLTKIFPTKYSLMMDNKLIRTCTICNYLQSIETHSSIDPLVNSR